MTVDAGTRGSCRRNRIGHFVSASSLAAVRPSTSHQPSKRPPVMKNVGAPLPRRERALEILSHPQGVDAVLEISREALDGEAERSGVPDEVVGLEGLLVFAERASGLQVKGLARDGSWPGDRPAAGDPTRRPRRGGEPAQAEDHDPLHAAPGRSIGVAPIGVRQHAAITSDPSRAGRKRPLSPSQFFRAATAA